MIINNAYAQGVDAVSATGGIFGSVAGTVGYIVVLGLLFYFLFIRPQRKQYNEHKKVVEELKVNDEVLMQSGIIGKIKKIEDKEFVIEIAKEVSVKVLKAYVIGKI